MMPTREEALQKVRDAHRERAETAASLQAFVEEYRGVLRVYRLLKQADEEAQNNIFYANQLYATIVIEEAADD